MSPSPAPEQSGNPAYHLAQAPLHPQTPGAVNTEKAARHRPTAVHRRPPLTLLFLSPGLFAAPLAALPHHHSGGAWEVHKFTTWAAAAPTQLRLQLFILSLGFKK